MSRARHHSLWQRSSDALQSLVYREGWPARLSYGAGLHGPVRVRSHEFIVGDRAAPALRIAFGSDFHAGPCTDNRILAQAVDRMMDFEPDVVLLGGDFVSHHERHAARFVAAAAALRPRHGTYAVLGNHDLYADDAAIARTLERAGINVLINENARLPAPFGQYWICGLDDPVTGAPHAGRALSGADGVRLMLMHSPGGLASLQPHRFDVAFAGHSHGGQIALPGGRPIVLPGNRYCRRYPHGVFENVFAPRQHLLVSKGVGCSDLPIRLFAESEVHCVELNPARQGPGRSSRCAAPSAT